MNRFRRSLAAGVAGLILAAGMFLVPAAVHAQERGRGPTSLVLTYRCKPEHRAALRADLEGAGGLRFEAWRKQGRFSRYQIFFGAFANDGGLDLAVILDFDRFADLVGWEEIERTMPGGLTPASLALVATLTADLADRLWEGAAPDRDRRQAVDLLIPYNVTVELSKYKSYVAGYVVPQLDGWLRAGAMAAYDIYLNQNAAGASWSSLLVLEYKGLDGLAQRNTLKGKVRDELAENPVWKKWSDDKTAIRTELKLTIADPVIPR